MRRVSILSIVFLAALSGCLGFEKVRLPQTRQAPECSGKWAFAGDELEVLIETLARRKRHEPKIENVIVISDAGQVPAAVHIRRGRSRWGYHQVVRFHAPPDSENVEAQLTVRHLGRRFRMVVTFGTVPVRDDIRWERLGTVVSEI